MIARPKMSQNELKTTEIRASKVGNFSLFSCPGRGRRRRRRPRDRGPRPFPRRPSGGGGGGTSFARVYGCRPSPQVRRGDACQTFGGPRVPGRRRCFPVEDYVRAALEMARRYGVGRVVLATDSPTAVDDFAAIAGRALSVEALAFDRGEVRSKRRVSRARERRRQPGPRAGRRPRERDAGPRLRRGPGPLHRAADGRRARRAPRRRVFPRGPRPPRVRGLLRRDLGGDALPPRGPRHGGPNGGAAALHLPRRAEQPPRLGPAPRPRRRPPRVRRGRPRGSSTTILQAGWP